MIKFALNFTYLLLILEIFCIINYYIFINKPNFNFYQNYFLNTLKKFIFKKKVVEPRPVDEPVEEVDIEQVVQTEPQPEREEYWSNMINVMDKFNNLLVNFFFNIFFIIKKIHLFFSLLKIYI